MGASIATRIASLAAGAGSGLLIFLGAVALDSAAVDLATPRAGRCAPLLDELLEAAEVALDAHVVGAEHVADPLGNVGGLPVHLDLDLGLLADRDEAHDAIVPRAGR